MALYLNNGDVICTEFASYFTNIIEYSVSVSVWIYILPGGTSYYSGPLVQNDRGDYGVYVSGITITRQFAPTIFAATGTVNGTNTAYQDNRWVHFGYVFYSKNGLQILRYFFNGRLDQVVQNSSPWVNLKQSNRIGTISGYARDYKMWGRALSDAEMLRESLTQEPNRAGLLQNTRFDQSEFLSSSFMSRFSTNQNQWVAGSVPPALGDVGFNCQRFAF